MKKIFLGVVSLLFAFSFVNNFNANEVENYEADDKASEILEEIDGYAIPNISENNTRSVFKKDLTLEERELQEKVKFKERILEKNEDIINEMSEDMRYKVVEAALEKEAQITINRPSTRGINDEYNDRGRGPGWAVRVSNVLYTNYQVTQGFRHGHIAIISNVEGYVLEASTTKNNGAKVFHWSYKNLWPRGQVGNVFELHGVQQIGTTYIMKPLTLDQRLQIVNYAKKQVGKPYGLNGALYGTSDFYCSKLVQQAYASAKTNAGLTIKASNVTFGMVLPLDIAQYRLNLVWKHIGYTSVYDYK